MISATSRRIVLDNTRPKRNHLVQRLPKYLRLAHAGELKKRNVSLLGILSALQAAKTL